MDAVELQALSKIEGRLGRMEALQEANVRSSTELSANVNRLVEKLERSDDVAREALDKAKSAHHRLDEINVRLDTDKAERKSDKHWMIGTTFTAVSVTAVVVSLILKIMGK